MGVHVRVLTFNIQDGGKGREPIIFDTLKTLQPDVIFLQEIIDPDLAHHWAKQLNLHSIVAKGNSLRHVAILSRYPILSWESYCPTPLVSRDFLAATIEYQPRKMMNIYGVHLSAQPFAAFEWLRLLEIKSVLQHAAQDTSTPCLIGGDFNAVSATDTHNTDNLPFRLRLMLFLQGNRFLHHVISALLTAQFTDCFRALNTDAGFTLPPPTPTIRFDYIFANAALVPSLQSCSVVPLATPASDHYPLLATFAI